MTPEQAKAILRRVWGGATVLDKAEAALIEPECQGSETFLDCCQRIAGDTYNWRKPGAFSETARRHFASL